MNLTTFRNVEWGPWIAVSMGIPLFVVGALRFVSRHRFGFIDALHCCLAVVPAALLLLVLAYVIQHARLVAVMPLFVTGVLLFTYPVFDIGLGVALIAVVAGPALTDWKAKSAS